MEAQEKPLREMSNAELKQAFMARRGIHWKLNFKAGTAILAALAFALTGLAINATAPAIALLACVAGSFGAMCYSSICVGRFEENKGELRQLWKEANLRRQKAITRHSPPPHLFTGVPLHTGMTGFTQELKPVFGMNAPSKDSAKIPQLAPVKIKPITNWN